MSKAFANVKKLNAIIYASDYGAKADGVTNDATALQSAITAAVAIGGVLVLNPGVYELGTASLSVAGPCQISGVGATLRRSGDAIVPVLNVTGSNVSIENVVIASTYASAPTADANNCALLFNGGANVYAENVSVSGRFYVGIELASVSGAVLTDCRVKGVRNRCYYAYLNWSDIAITNCVADGAETGTTPYCDYGFNLNPAGLYTPTRAIITGCTAQNCTSQGFSISERSYYTTLNSCIATNIPSGYGFLVQRANGFDGLGSVISGCQAIQCQIGFYVIQSFYVDLIGCHSISNTIDGIQINDSQYVGVNGCISRNNTATGINIFASAASLASRITLSGNRCVSNGGYGIFSNADCYGIAASTNIGIFNTTGQISISGTANQVGNGANIVV